jgi:soluble lytic murein transglycosylase
VARNRSRRGSGAGRFLLAAAVLGIVALAVLRGPDAYLRASHPLSHEATISAAAASANVDPYLIAAVINAESGFRDTVVSSAGAVGLMQVKPSTAKAVAHSIGVSGKMTESALSNPDTNIRVGTAYLAELVTRYHGSVDLALAAYNAGLTNADEWAQVWKPSESTLSATIDFPETARYVEDVLAQMAVYRRLYPGAFASSGK